MKAYIVIEWNGQTYEDADYTNVAVYLDEGKAYQHITEFNNRKQPSPLPEEFWVQEYPTQTYNDYLEDLEHDWIYRDGSKKQHIQEIEITQ